MTKWVQRRRGCGPPPLETGPDLPTKEEAWAEFWDILVPALVQAHRRGELPQDPVEYAALRAQREESSRSRLQKLGYCSADIRAWLAAQGRPVHRVGRLSNDLLAEYEEAMGHSVSKSAPTDAQPP
ncbi:hypothetical protein GKE56_14995 [Nostocoides sp. HKS02]|nr:hypothetical protein GKE56_14995 [Tetrasphaera sp. HKS02]